MPDLFEIIKHPITARRAPLVGDTPNNSAFVGYYDGDNQYVALNAAPNNSIDNGTPKHYTAQVIPLVIPRGMTRLATIGDDYTDPTYVNPYGGPLFHSESYLPYYRAILLDRVEEVQTGNTTSDPAGGDENDWIVRSSTHCCHLASQKSGIYSAWLPRRLPLNSVGANTNISFWADMIVRAAASRVDPCSVKVAIEEGAGITAAASTTYGNYLAVSWDWKRGYAGPRYGYVRRELKRVFMGKCPVPMVGLVTSSRNILWAINPSDRERRERWHEEAWKPATDLTAYLNKGIRRLHTIPITISHVIVT